MATEYLNNKNFEKIISKFQEAKREKIKCETIVKEASAVIGKTAKKKKQLAESCQIAELSYQLAKAKFDEYQIEIAAAFYVLSENIVRYAKFNLIDQDDAIQEGVMICFEKIDRFDPTKGKAFNYMTTCIINSLRQTYRSAKNYNELKKKYHNHLQDSLNIHPGNTTRKPNR